ncbi:zf-HC2 domain-containing protein, partial [bacterium]|nr:zf-HC2 domain-containing protein [bacterium]
MANEKSNRCVDPAFYLRLASGPMADENRFVLIGKYLEEELPISAANEMEQHLETCGSCRQFLAELERAGASEAVWSAVCPASEILDAFLFDPHILPIAEKQKIAAHMEECTLCKEEIDWLRNIERSTAVDVSRYAKRWLTYSAAIAAVFLLALISVITWRGANTALPNEELRALAVIKQPEDINFETLARTSIPLSTAGKEIYEQGVQFFKARNYDQAAIRFQSVLNTTPHSGSLFLLGFSYYGMGKEEQAFELCEQAEEMEPKANERCLFLVHIALKTGHFDRAIMEICGLYHDSPNDPV